MQTRENVNKEAVKNLLTEEQFASVRTESTFGVLRVKQDKGSENSPKSKAIMNKLNQTGGTQNAEADSKIWRTD